MDYSLKSSEWRTFRSATSEPFGSESTDHFVNIQQSPQAPLQGKEPARTC